MAFSECTSLTSIYIGNSVNNICDCAFHSCSSLDRVTIPHSVTHIGSFAFYASSLTRVTFGTMSPASDTLPLLR